MRPLDAKKRAGTGLLATKRVENAIRFDERLQIGALVRNTHPSLISLLCLF